MFRAQLLELQSQLDQLLLTYTDQYPDVVRIRHQMAISQQATAPRKTARRKRGAPDTPAALDRPRR